ncbi:MAG: helix-turn-helix transcriptional regulator [Ruminococcaceae bacterium]|nr:helix-turn-helix transcriptional regulator [Oscillospiraceae bacterium]
MDQIKIGRFIAQCRKNEGLTQMQLAEKLGVTDRAVSKWENGRAMPDSSIMLALCEQLKITVNDLLSGEVVTMENYNKELENNLINMVRLKEKNDRRLLQMEIVMGVIAILPLLFAAVLVLAVPMEEWLGGLIAGCSAIPILIATPFALRIEQTAGYYKCAKCGHTHIPNYKNVFMAMHYGRTRYMKCPECHKRSWQKKVLTKEK